ncbi:G2/mitotic-specific cyclin C13-1-like [Mercurialis annua]|uniref:G2/mitotic-specific cyclin C13-1-like n=1 Tax=Mercurialis annua TaxID=3986 RepID=UPI00215FECDB|nr:G2/mitotic-specific cyclin C13-1-like [Mercurialis annua]
MAENRIDFQNDSRQYSTRSSSSRKRAFSDATDALQPAKKRVHLGEITNRVTVTESTRNSGVDSSNQLGGGGAFSKVTDSLQLAKKRVQLGEITNTVTGTELTRNSDGDSTPVQQQRRQENQKQQNDGDDLEDDSLTIELTQNSDVEISTRNTTCEVKKCESEISLSSGSNRDLALKKCLFSSSIYGHLHSLEMDDKRRCSSNYMTAIQTDISAKMREILVDWLVEVAEEYKLVSDTLYLSVSYLDRFLSSQNLSRHKLQLLGVSCMLIASKYEEISPPNVEDFCYITDNTYCKEEVVDMEKDVLKFLNYEMSTPTAKNFLRILAKAAHEESKSPDLHFEFLSCYLAELSLLDYQCLCFLPSVVAASAIFFARFIIKPTMHPWNASLQRCSGYRPSDLKECVIAISGLQSERKVGATRAVTVKYSQHKFKCVATLYSPSEIPAHYFDAIEE